LLRWLLYGVAGEFSLRVVRSLRAAITPLGSATQKHSIDQSAAAVNFALTTALSLLVSG